jgi:hypothetical protein
LVASVGLLPLVQAFEVFRGAEKSPTDTFHPRAMLMIVKACEVLFETLPEAIIQVSSIMQMQVQFISSIQFISLMFSFGAAGVILADGGGGNEKGQRARSPNNPTYGWLSGGRVRTFGCQGCYALYCSTCLFLTVVSWSTIYIWAGRSTLPIVLIVITELFAVFLFKAYQGALHARAQERAPTQSVSHHGGKSGRARQRAKEPTTSCLRPLHSPANKLLLLRPLCFARARITSFT